MRLNKIASVLLYVNVNNTSAIKLYEKLGFRIIKETKKIFVVRTKDVMKWN